MKHLFKWSALGLTSALLLTACGVTNTTFSKAAEAVAPTNKNTVENNIVEETEAIEGEALPPFYPLSEGEAPITVLSTTENGPYPDALRAELGLWDRTDDVWYTLTDVFPDNFTINRDHLYTARLWLYSDGNVIKNIRVEAQLPNTEDNPRSNCIRFVASDDETGQPLLSARMYLKSDDGEDFEIHPYVTEAAINYGGILIGDIGNEPTDAGGFEFSVSNLK